MGAFTASAPDSVIQRKFTLYSSLCASDLASLIGLIEEVGCDVPLDSLYYIPSVGDRWGMHILTDIFTLTGKSSALELAKEYSSIAHDLRHSVLTVISVSNSLPNRSCRCHASMLTQHTGAEQKPKIYRDNASARSV